METYLNADNDGVSDRVEIGCAQPDFTYGIASSFYYKNVDLSISLRGVSGIDVYNNTIAEFSYKNSAPGTNVLESAISSQTSREQIPQFSSQWIEGASYLRLDNLSIGYSFNTTNISYLSRARIYVTGQNLFVISQYSGYDPEVRTNTNSNKSGPVASGIDYLAYPRPRVFMIGASVAF
jgi:TonB-dependent starch-binding outer membrane protein SusC